MAVVIDDPVEIAKLNAGGWGSTRVLIADDHLGLNIFGSDLSLELLARERPEDRFKPSHRFSQIVHITSPYAHEYARIYALAAEWAKTRGK